MQGIRITIRNTYKILKRMQTPGSLSLDWAKSQYVSDIAGHHPHKETKR